jgi:drug/metabolite transporter (DMT)-like permease
MAFNFLPVIWCLVAAALFGASTPASKAVLSSIHPITLAGLLYLGVVPAVLPFAFKGGAHRPLANPIGFWKLPGAVLFGGILGPVFLMYGLSKASASSVSLWLNFESIATVGLAWLFFKEHFTKKTWVGVVAVLVAGVILVEPKGLGSFVPATMVALACICWGMDNNLTSTIDRFTPAQIAFAKGLVAGTVNLCIGLAVEGPIQDPRLILLSLLIGAIGYGVSIVLYVASAQQLGASRSMMLFATGPFWGVIFSWIGLSEPVRLIQIAAGTIMVAGLWVMISERHEHAHRHQAISHTHAHSHNDAHHGHVHENVPPGVQHTHEHSHDAEEHSHPHLPDLHHRHIHKTARD